MRKITIEHVIGFLIFGGFGLLITFWIISCALA